MQQTFNTAAPAKQPHSIAVTYSFNPATGYYQKTDSQPHPQPVQALPYELRRENAQAAQIKCNVRECLLLRERKKTNGSRPMFTGLEPLIYENWYAGNAAKFIMGNKITSLLILHFSADHSRLTVYYYSGWDKPTRALRESYAEAVIPTLLQREGQASC